MVEVDIYVYVAKHFCSRIIFFPSFHFFMRQCVQQEKEQWVLFCVRGKAV